MDPQSGAILIVDDELGIREGCRRVLGQEGHRVVVAASGEEGWQKAQSGQFALAFLDVMMPDLSGIELLRRIVAFDPDLVCIIITGYATIELAVQAIKEGAYDFIAKPFEAGTLLLAAHQGLERRRLTQQARRLAQIELEKEELERRTAELEREALERRTAELEELDRVKSSFMRTVAHELRAPAGAIQSYLRLMLDGYIPSEKYSDYLARSEKRIAGQLELIDDLLEMARLQNPDVHPQRELVNVSQSLREVCELMQERAQEKGIALTVQTPQETAVVLADPRHIQQLWCNLVGNAIKYTGESETVTVTMKVADGGIVTSVRDTGIGIAAEELPRIFEEFYRTKAAKEHAETGTGLGLAIVRRIVDTYQGHIDVQSRVGQGSTFTVTLPASAHEQPGAAAQDGEKSPTQTKGRFSG